MPSTERTWFSTTLSDEFVRGALELEHTDRGVLPHRLPAWARRQIPDGQLAMAESQPSGVRVVFRSRATSAELDVLATKRVYRGAPPRPDGVFELYVDGRPAGRASVPEGDVVTLDLATGAAETVAGPVRTLRFEHIPGDGDHPGHGPGPDPGPGPGPDPGSDPAPEREFEIWLPHDETTRLVELRADAPVRPAPPSGRRRWLHHGSSISHGSNAASPSGTWPAVAARLGEVDLVNLGFGGSALLDPFTARTLRDAPADLISVKTGINLVNTDAMRLRAFGPAVHGFLDTIREGHPDIPLLVVSPVYCAIHEEAPGPSAVDVSAMAEGRLRFTATGDPAEVAAGKLTLTVIRAELARIVRERSADDANLHYIDGLELYGGGDYAEHPLPDELHPGPDTHRAMGERFARLAFGGGGPFARTTG